MSEVGNYQEIFELFDTPQKHALAQAQGPPAVFSAFCRAQVLICTLRAPKGPAPLSEERHVLACMGWAGEKAGLFEQPLFLPDT